MARPDTEDLYPLHNFTGDFANWVKGDHDIRYCFVIGAGASRSSGIPTGASLVDDWLRSRFEQECPKAPRDEIQPWAEKTFKKWKGFSWDNRAACYGRIYEWYYRDKATGQAALRKLIHGKSPSFGYSVLAMVLAKTKHKVVLTTNFDNLIRDAIHLHLPDEDPFMCHGEEDAPFLAGHATRIRIAKMHGDIDRKTYNAAPEIEKLHNDWDLALRGIFTEYTPIFLGYGGNDPGVMDFFTDKLAIGQFRARPIWAYRVALETLPKSGAPDPSPPGWPEGKGVHQFMEKHHGLWLPIPGFDEFMMLLGHCLEYVNQAPLIRGGADRRAKDYERTLSEAVKALRLIPCKTWCPQMEALAAAAELRLLGEVKRRTWDEWRVALEASPSRQETARLLAEATRELQDSPELKAYYASFLADEKPNAPEVDAMIQEARLLAERSVGADSPAMLAVLHHLARIHSLRGQAKESLAIAENVLNLRRGVLGLEHPDTLRTLTLIANALSAQGKPSEAEKLHRQTLEVRERTLGKEHPETLRSVNNLANALSAQGNKAEAEKLYRQTLDVQERTLGKEHPETLGSVNNLALALSDQGKPAEAEKLYRQALEVQERTLGKEHPDTLRCVSNLANALSAQGKKAEAEKLYRQALEVQERTLGKEHLQTQRVRANLEKLLEKSPNKKGK